MKKILTIVGARPQFIKCSPVSRELRKYFDEIIVHTGQHYDNNMSDIFFEELNIPRPDYNLEIGSHTHAVQTGKMLIELEKLAIKIAPDLILIYGDTNSTLAGAIVAAKLLIPLIHVESGLRSFNKKMPEELNRICADHFSSILFCPTEAAVENLAKEGIKKNVFNVGDVMKDAVVQNSQTMHVDSILAKYGMTNDRPYYYFTLHRQENTDNLVNLRSILEMLGNEETEIIFPIHPRTEKIITGNKIPIPSNFKVISPTGYLESLALQKKASIVLTDSGGIQKESFILGTPCITLREETEWIETVHAGYNTVVGIDRDKFYEAKEKYLNPIFFSTHSNDGYYGNGDAAIKITELLREYYA